MSATLGITIIVFLVLAAVGLGVVLLLLGVVVFLMRRRSAPPPSRTARPEPAPAPPPAPVSASPRPTPIPSKPPTPSVPPDPSAPPPALGGGLLGFFDDEVTTRSTPASGEVESAKTELFQRGKMAIDWDDDEDEGEATEIFSAHGAAGDLAEFAFDDDEQSTGRFD